MNGVLEEQKDFFEFIKGEISNNKLSHAYLIETNGYDKVNDLVKLFTKFLLCRDSVNSDGKCVCNICKLVDNDDYPDIIYVEADGNFIKKEQLIEVQKQFRNKSAFDNKQIYVIRDATALNSSSANTMLKFLEEPESDIIAILVANNRYKVIDTIVSRCQVLSLKHVNDLIVSDEIKDLFCNIFSKDKAFLMYNKILEFVPDKKIFSGMLKNMENILFRSLSDNNYNYLDVSNKKIIDFILIIEDIMKKAEFNVSYKLLLDDFFIRIMEVYGEKC